MTFVDTNYFLRYLLADVVAQHLEAKTLFQKGAAGKLSLSTSLLVLFEIYWVLTSFYEKSKPEVIPILESVLSLSFIQLENRSSFEEALQIFKKTSLELEDCYNLVIAKQQKAKMFASFDKGVLKYWDKWFVSRLDNSKLSIRITW